MIRIRRALQYTVSLIMLLMAQTAAGQGIQVDYLGIDKGLSNNAVTTIFQDHNGFMWFGTYDGLNRFDGYGFRVYRNVIGDSTSIQSNSINAISEDAAYNIWVGGQKDISIYHPVTNRFSKASYHLLNGKVLTSIADNVTAIRSVRPGLMLAGTQHNGLFRFDSTTANGIQVPLLLHGEPTVNYYVSDIKYSPLQNTLYVFVQNEGLFTYDFPKRVLRPQNLLIKQANCIGISRTGTVWLGSNDGLFRVSDSTTVPENSFPEKAAVVNLTEDRKGNLWIASDGAGVWLLPPAGQPAIPLSSLDADKRQLINSNAVYAVYEDNQERKWIGTLRGGVNIIQPPSNGFSKIVYRGGNPNNAVDNFILSFCEETDSTLWIGTDGAGLRSWNRNRNTYRSFVHDKNDRNSISSNFITSIVKEGEDDVWISTWFGGINRFNRKSGLFRQYSCINPITGSPSKNVWTLLYDHRKRLWAVAVRNGGLFLYDRRKDTFNCADSSLTDLQCLAEDADGNLWCGDYSSLIKLDTVTRKHTFYNIGYPVRCIYQDKRKNLWVGTQEGGLLLFNRTNGSFQRITTADGLPHNTILRMLEDREGNLWLSTYNGLSKFDPQRKRFRNFFQSDGLQSNQFSFNGALALGSGEFVFGGIKGFNIFHPEQIAGRKAIPRLFLTGIKVNNSPVEEDPGFIEETTAARVSRIRIPYDAGSVTLDFLGLDYSEAAEISYAYFLEGWDKGWNYVNDTRTANYSRLREGNYLFRVKASNSSGTWSQQETLLYITVLPPWYRSWWAYGLYALMGACAIYLYTLYKNRQARLQYEIQLAHLETQQVKELNEKKIAFFTNVSHEFRTPLSLIINPVKDLLTRSSRTEDTELKVVYRNAQRLLRLVDQLLLFKKADSETDKPKLAKLDYIGLCRDVFACFTEQARAKKIRYEFHCGLQRLMISADREKLEIALFNIVSNAFKYTPGQGRILLSVEEENGKIRTTVSDTGEGISPEEGERLYDRFYQAKEDSGKGGFGIGLYLVRSFINAHHGEVFYTSEKGKGTSFTILLPGIEHDSSEPAPDGNADLIETLPVKADQETGLQRNGKHNERLQVDKPAAHPAGSALLSELHEAVMEEEPSDHDGALEIASDKPALLVIDDDSDIRHYLVSIFSSEYKVYQADCAEDGIRLAHEQLPDLIISDIVMNGLNGLDLCKTLKLDPTVSHIPIILLTGTSSDEMQVQGMESGADDYIKKPFDKGILVARVHSLLKRRSILQRYFYNEITLGTGKYKVSAEYREFLQQCIRIIESHLMDENFSVKTLISEIGMSHTSLYKKVKSVSGQSINSFIRFIRLRKAAEIFISTEHNVNETANMVGFYDVKYFRAQFFKLFGLNPSEYIKKYRKPFRSTGQP